MRPQIPPYAQGATLPQHGGPFRSMPARTVQKAGAPLAWIIVAAVGVAITAFLALSESTSTGIFLVGVLIATLGAVLVIGAYMWLDRWEPEPPSLLVWAFLWGGGVATVGALILQDLFYLFAWGDNDLAASVIGAPLFEEGLKGAFLLLMMTGARRKEMTSLTDALVYAGMAGIGFAFVENLLYFGRAESFGDVGFMFFARILMGAFAHPFFTTMIALGVWYAMKQRSQAARIALILAGFAGAMVLHGLWNGSAQLGLGGYFITYLIVMMPAFIVLVRQAVRSRKREGQIVAKELPEMVWTGLVSPQEAGWLASLEHRKHRVASVPKDQAKVLAEFTDAVTELAFVRDRIKRGFSTPEIQEHQSELAMFLASRHQAAHQAMEPFLSRAPRMEATPPPPQAPMPMDFHHGGWQDGQGPQPRAAQQYGAQQQHGAQQQFGRPSHHEAAQQWGPPRGDDVRS